MIEIINLQSNWLFSLITTPARWGQSAEGIVPDLSIKIHTEMFLVAVDNEVRLNQITQWDTSRTLFYWLEESTIDG